MLLPEGKRSTEWVKRLADVVSALNNEVASLIGKKPAVVIKEKSVSSKPSTKYNRPVGVAEKKLPPLCNCKILEVASYSNLNNYRGTAVRDIRTPLG